MTTPSATPAEAMLVYTVSAAPVPSSPGDGLTFEPMAYEPVTTPTTDEWTARRLPGTPKPCALVDAGVYLTSFKWHPSYLAAGVDVVLGTVDDPRYEDVDPSYIEEQRDYFGLGPWWATFTPDSDRASSSLLVATRPVRLYAIATATTDDAARTIDATLRLVRLEVSANPYLRPGAA